MKSAKTKYSILSLALSCVLLHLAGVAPASGVNFETLKSEAILTGEISDIYQDREGYIWVVANNGLVRYDGYYAEPYFLLSGNEERFESLLHTIIEGDGPYLYIGTERGIIKLDKITGEACILKDRYVERINVSSMAKDASGRIWIGCEKGLVLKNRETDEFHPVNLNTGTKALTDITSLLADSRGNLWITSWYEGLFRYNLTTGTFHRYTHGCLDRAYTLHEDSKGNIWVGTWGKGLVEIPAGTDISRETISFIHYGHDPDDRKSVIDGTIYKIGEDSEGKIWIGSRSGLSILDPEHPDAGFDNYYPGSRTGQLPYNEVNCILRTRDDAMFIGMMGGGICKALQSDKDFSRLPMEKIQNMFNTSSVYGLAYEGDGMFWLGISGHGPVLYDSRTGNFTNYIDIPIFKGYFGTSTVEEIIYARDSTLTCFASYNRGLWIFDRECNSIKVINSTTCPDMNEDCLYAICEDLDSNIWIGTKKGVFMLDGNWNLLTLSDYMGSGESNPQFKATDITCDGSGNIWIATSYDGIICIDTEKRELKSYGSETSGTDSFICILADSRSEIWAGSSRNGLYRYNRQNDRFVKVEGLVFLENTPVVNLTEDPYGRIWASTQTSVISFLETGENTFGEMRYWNLPGSTSPFFLNNNASTWCLGEECMAFGTSKGVLTFPGTSETGGEQQKCTIALSNIRTADRRIVLEKGQTNFRIDFTLFNYNNQYGDIYRYRLHKGKKVSEENQWMIVNGAHSYAAFSDMKPGNYLFEVYGSKAGSSITSDTAVLSVFIPCNPWKSWWAICLYIFGGAVLAGFALFSAVTHLRLVRTEEINRINLQKTEEVNLAKLQFFTNVSHELLSPLNIILASVENILPHNEQEKGILNIMSANAVRLTRLVQQILDFRQTESDSLKIKVSKNNVSEFISNCVEAFIPLVRKNNLKISFSSDPRDITGYFDPDKLDKIIYNLISNAVKHSPPQSTITVEIKSLRDNILYVSCAHEGELMSTNTISRIFNRFYEGDYKKFNAIGTGLAMSIVKSMITLHKGETMVESNEAVGNRISFTIPVGREYYTEDEIDSSSGAEANANIPISVNSDEPVVKQDYTVLYVDDNEEYRQLLYLILSKRFNIVTCPNAEEAIDILKNRTIDLVVSEIMIPEMSGTELCSYIKGNIEFSHIPVILFTASRSDSASIEGYECGADGYLTKQCNFSVLSAMIGNFFKKQEKKSKDFRKQMVLEVPDVEYTSIDKMFLQKAISVVNDHLSDSEFGLSEFSKEMSMSRTILTEKLKRLTGMTPGVFILNARLTTAYKIATSGTDNVRVSELAYSLGFSDPKYFSKRFKIKYGKSPKTIIEENTKK